MFALDTGVEAGAKHEMNAHDDDPANPSWAQEALDLVVERVGYQVPQQRVQPLLEAVRRISREGGFLEERDCVRRLRTLPNDAAPVQRFLACTASEPGAFFDGASAISGLRSPVLPDVIAACAPHKTLRVWSAGCGTGEDIYTLGILLREQIADIDQWMVTLAATDVSYEALERGRVAEYPEASLRSVPEQRRELYFEPRPGGRFSLREPFRRGVTFMNHNLADASAPSPAPGRFDLIVCRGVLARLSAEARKAAERCFQGALSPNGVWVADASDPEPSSGFVTKDVPGLLVHRLASAPMLVPSAPPSAPPASAPEASPSARPRRHAVTRPLRAPRIAGDPPPRAPSHPPPVASLDYAGAASLAEVRDLADGGDLESAQQVLNTLLHRYPMVPAVYVMQGLLLEARGDLQSAEQEWTRALYLDPVHLEAHLRLGLVLIRLGRVRRGKAVLRRGVCLPDSERPETERLRLMAAEELIELLDHDE